MVTARSDSYAASSGGGVYAGIDPIVPLWTLMAAGTVAAMPGNMLADINPDNSAAINPLHGGGASPVAAPWHGLGYWPNIITSWCGLSFDPTLWEARMTNPGGHDGWWAPCSMRWNLLQETPAWSLVNVPPGAVGAVATSYSIANAYFNNAVGGVNYWDMPDAAGTGSSGIPRAIHTTNYAFFAPGIGHGNADEITIAPSGGSDPTHQCGYIVSDTTGLPIITSASGPNGSGGYSCAAFDTTRGYVWKKGTGSFTYFDKWNLTNGAAWTHGSTLGFYLSGPSSLEYSPDLDLILVGNGGAPGQTLSGGWAILDPNPASGLFYATALAGLGSHIAGSQAGATFVGAENGQYACGLHPGECQPRWSAIDQCFYAWDMTTGSTHKLMRIKHTSGDPRNGTWTIDYLTFTGATPSARTGNGTYGRGFLIDDARLFVVVNSVNETGWKFKLS